MRAAILLLAGLWVFWPAVQGGWLWDDYSEITHNPQLRSPAGLIDLWLAPSGADYFPLKSTVQWLEWQAWGDHSTLGYHLTSIGLHLLSALLAWRLFHRLGLRLAWLGGLLFAIHPLVVESVAWMAELKNTLSLPLLLLAMLAWLDYDERHRPADYAKAALFFLAAMLCKTSVVMFPAVQLLHAWWRRGRISRADLRASAPFFVISLGLGLVTVWFQSRHAIGDGGVDAGGPFPRLAGAGLALAFYFRQAVFPVALMPVYPRWTLDPPSPGQFLPWLLLVLIAAWCWRWRATWGRHVLFGGGFFVLNLLPVLGFIIMAYLRISWVADHFAYLPLLGLLGLGVAGAGILEGKLAPLPRRYALGAAVVVCGLLALESRRYAALFCDAETFWTGALQRNPQAWLAHHNLGYLALQSGHWPEAIAESEKALQLNPDHAGAHNNLGAALTNAGRPGEAVGHFEQALRLGPDDAVTRCNLGSAELQLGRIPDAIGEFERALRLAPDLFEAHNNLGSALLQSGRLPEAMAHYQRALELQPGNAEVHNNLGYALALAGRDAEAVREFEAALRLQPDYAQARDNLARLQARQP